MGEKVAILAEKVAILGEKVVRLRQKSGQNGTRMPSNDARRNLQSNAPHESFWDALGLGIEPFLCFT